MVCFCEHGDGTSGSIERRGNISQELLGTCDAAVPFIAASSVSDFERL